ncbi:hypothetical protein P280DRAFT_536617 [Massarina eburnea CBS 473.64]|uniref:Uncharacterized protein n=1 Tax=Massarina eburnea CBS 473.64 TaxID=1395130 RepID=A0A6A6RIH9_9PLEO|nr:hypothetical protein P280DRAFT_536617 [Massarina eburnea CBS 473.64]
MSRLAGKNTVVSLIFNQDVNIDKSGDLTITVLSPIENGVRHVTDFLVSTQVCEKSPYLKPIIAMAEDPTEICLGEELKREGANKFGEKEGEDTEGVLVWLAHLHELTEEHMALLGLHEISITGIWHAIHMWNVFEHKKDMKALQPWFNKWCATNLVGKVLDLDTARLLALPCQIFDHAVGFATITRYLAYNHTGHIKACQQPKGCNANLTRLAPNDFLGPTNHARGGLKTALTKSLWKKAGDVLRFKQSKCNCWDATVGQYLGALVQLDAFPIEDVITHSSIREILERLKKFKYDWQPKCDICAGIDWLYVIKKTIVDTERYFDGLCLDCMDRSKPKGNCLDDKYWKANASGTGGRWDHRCRIKHNQPTWYVSWLGRDDTRQKLLKGASGGYRPMKDE